VSKIGVWEVAFWGYFLLSGCGGHIVPWQYLFLDTTQQQRRHDSVSEKNLMIHLCNLTIQMRTSPEHHRTYHA
jgi:hypothetical protein